MVIKIGSLLSIHTASLGAPILLEEAKAAGVKSMALKPLFTTGVKGETLQLGEVKLSLVSNW